MSDFNTTISFDVFSVSLSFVDEGTFVVVKQYVDEQLDSKQDTLIAGENITIIGNVISSTSGGSIEHDDTLNKNGNPDFLHITQAEKDDFAIKAYAYERVNVAPTIALKLATQTAIVQTLTSANTFAITLPTPRLNKVNESIITFRIDQSIPDIIFPMVAGWNTEEFVLSADRTRTIVFQQITFDGVNWETWASCDRNS